MSEIVSSTNLILMESKQTRHKDKSDQDLAELCLDTNLSPQERLERWDEFFRRFSRLIINTINLALWNCGDKKDGFWTDEDITWNIHAEVVYKLVNKGILKSCTNLAGLIPWLTTVSENQAVQWLRDNGRLRKLPKKNAEDGMLPLEEPVYDDDDKVTRGDIIKKRGDIYRFERLHLETILERLDGLRNSSKKTGLRNYWIMRLSIIAQLPLAKEDKSDLLQFSPLPRQEAVQKLDEIIATTERRENKREAKLGLSIIRESKLRRLESLYMELSKYDDVKAQEVAEKIEKVSGWRVKLLKAGMIIPRPYNADIAAVVGLKPKQSDYVTKIIQRTRKKFILSKDEKEAKENSLECQILEMMSL